MEHRYYTVARQAEGLFREKGSEFLGYVWPVDGEDSIREKIAQIKALHPKARHICTAWRLGVGEVTEFATDAGEPAGSAGLPMLNELRSRNLTNVLVVVVRYFGGTKLGIPGLIHAYREAAGDALDQAGSAWREMTERVDLEVPYAQADAVFRQTARSGGRIVHQEMGQTCRMAVEVPLAQVAAFRDALASYVKS